MMASCRFEKIVCGVLDGFALAVLRDGRRVFNSVGGNYLARAFGGDLASLPDKKNENNICRR